MNLTKEDRDFIWKIGNELKTISVCDTAQKLYYILIKLRIQRNMLNNIVSKIEDKIKENSEKILDESTSEILDTQKDSNLVTKKNIADRDFFDLI
jgi:hypothetical protein